MKNNLSSVQRRLLKEQEEEIELEIPEGDDEVEPSPPTDEGADEMPLEEPDEGEGEAPQREGESDKAAPSRPSQSSISR